MSNILYYIMLLEENKNNNNSRNEKKLRRRRRNIKKNTCRVRIILLNREYLSGYCVFVLQSLFCQNRTRKSWMIRRIIRGDKSLNERINWEAVLDQYSQPDVLLFPSGTFIKIMQTMNVWKCRKVLCFLRR